MNSKYKFFNIPKEYGKNDYEEAIDCIIKKYSNTRNLLSIYSWGCCSVPGISDIDIVFVFGDMPIALPFLKRSFYFLNPRDRYLARHPFIFIGKQSFGNVRCIYPDTDFQLLHGKNIKIKKSFFSEAYYSRISLLNDICVRHYPRDFLFQLVNKSINVRDTLLRLNSLKYSINILANIAKVKDAEWNGKLRLIERLRKEWFKVNNFELLASLNEDAVGITLEIINEFNSFLKENKFVDIKSGDKVVYNGLKNRSIFVRNWNKDKALQEMIRLAKNKQFRSILPIELAVQLVEYSKHSGLISSYIRENIKNNAIYKLKYRNVAKKRILILNKQAELSYKLKHSDFAAFFDFGYRNKAGINNWILNLLDKIRH